MKREGQIFPISIVLFVCLYLKWRRVGEDHLRHSFSLSAMSECQACCLCLSPSLRGVCRSQTLWFGSSTVPLSHTHSRLGSHAERRPVRPVRPSRPRQAPADIITVILYTGKVNALRYGRFNKHNTGDLCRSRLRVQFVKLIEGQKSKRLQTKVKNKTKQESPRSYNQPRSLISKQQQRRQQNNIMVCLALLFLHWGSNTIVAGKAYSIVQTVNLFFCILQVMHNMGTEKKIHCVRAANGVCVNLALVSVVADELHYWMS